MPTERNSSSNAAYDFMGASPYAHIAYTLDMVVIDLNWRHTLLTGVPREDAIGRNVYDVFPPNPEASETDARPAVAASINRMVETREPDEMDVVQHDLPLPEGGFERRYWQLTHSPIFAGSQGTGEIVGALQTTRDVTAETMRQRMHDAQRRAAAASGELMFFELDIDTFEVTSTPGFDDFHGRVSGAPDERLSGLLSRIHPDDRNTVRTLFEDLRRAPDDTQKKLEYRVVLPDETTRWLTAHLEVVRGADGGSSRLTGMVLDVTDLRRSEIALHEAVEARDLLLAEVNHRVKNSLQLVTSVLNVEIGTAADVRVDDHLQRTAARVQAIASVHAMLYDSKDVTTVELGRFLRTIVDHIANSLGAEDQGISVSVDADSEPTFVSTDRAIALSLIVNEITTNAIKHAFPNGHSGRIDVVLRHVDNGKVSLRVADTGVGHNGTSTPDKRFQDEGGGLGSKIVKALAGQIGARLNYEDGPGHTVHLEFDV